MKLYTEICSFRTIDNERLRGALLTPTDNKSNIALIFIHGVAMNFYLPPLFNFGHELAVRGHHSFVINTRGHDWISRAGNLTKFGGSAYENLADCPADLDGAIDFLKRHHYRRFILIGHSLGAIKSIIYQGTQQRADVIGIVSCSAPKQFYSERIARQPRFRELIEQAARMVNDGNGEALMSVNVGATPGLFTARTHLDKYGKDDNNDCRPHAKDIGCPPLAIAGGAEPPFFHEYAQEIVAAAGGESEYRNVDGANHFYNRHTHTRWSRSSTTGCAGSETKTINHHGPSAANRQPDKKESVHHEGHEEHEGRSFNIVTLRVLRALRGEIEFSRRSRQLRSPGPADLRNPCKL